MKHYYKGEGLALCGVECEPIGGIIDCPECRRLAIEASRESAPQSEAAKVAVR